MLCFSTVILFICLIILLYFHQWLWFIIIMIIIIKIPRYLFAAVAEILSLSQIHCESFLLFLFRHWHKKSIISSSSPYHGILLLLLPLRFRELPPSFFNYSSLPPCFLPDPTAIIAFFSNLTPGVGDSSPAFLRK